MPRVIYTIGHSTRKLSDFIGMLQSHSVDLLVDIRTIPKSRYNPQFNGYSLKRRLEAKDIGYIHMKELGGLRKPDKDSVNMAWRNASFRGFADYMQTREFAGAVEKLAGLGKKRQVAIMCAEGNPFRCHRSLVADSLLARRYRVMHISSRTSASEHTLTRFAVVKGRKITYP